MNKKILKYGDFKSEKELLESVAEKLKGRDLFPRKTEAARKYFENAKLRVYKKTWTKEKCSEEALKYRTRKEFKDNSPNAYSASVRNKWLNDICQHMGEKKIKNLFWTKEKCAEEALKYNSRSEFEKGSPSAYVKSGKMGWKDEICLHMNTNGNKYNRCVYAIEFSDNHVYIGLTYDFEKRFSQHLNDIRNNSIVLRHFKKSGLNPIIKKLTNYIDVEEASKIEKLKVDEYFKNGWCILNIAKCGNVGGKTVKWTKEKCFIEALKYETRGEFKNKSPFSYNAARRNKWLDEICLHMHYKLKNWNIFSCEEESKKFKSKQEFKNKSSGAYGYAYNNNLLDQFFPKLSESVIDNYGYLPTYEECVDLCSSDDSPFYESKDLVDGYNISLFNYRLAKYSDFIIKPFAKEMRGLCFVFNKDKTVYKRFLLLEKFFNLNQVPESMYSIVKDYKIKYVNNKEDGSIASFIQLPNGKIVGRSKMGFDNDQANGVNKIYMTNINIKNFVDSMISMDYVPIFEYVSSSNRIVLKYSKEELILLRLRDNKTGKHIDIKNHVDKLGSIKIAPFKDDFVDLDSLIELTGTEVDKEGYVVQAVDENGKDFFFKLKTPWYCERHGLLTEDLYKENIILGYILDDKIDDILGQIPEDEKEARDRIYKLVDIVKKAIAEKSHDVDKLYAEFVKMNRSKRDFAIKYSRHKDFSIVMELVKADDLRKLTKEEIADRYVNIESYETLLNRLDKYELIKSWIKDSTKRLLLARNWIKKRDPEMFFRNPIENEEDN